MLELGRRSREGRLDLGAGVVLRQGLGEREVLAIDLRRLVLLLEHLLIDLEASGLV